MDYTDIRMQLEAVEDKEIGEKTLFYNIPIVMVKNGVDQEYHPLFMEHVQATLKLWDILVIRLLSLENLRTFMNQMRSSPTLLH